MLQEIRNGDISDMSVRSSVVSSSEVQGLHSFTSQRASRKFYCSTCSKSFFTVRFLRRHVVFQHVSRNRSRVAVPKEFSRRSYGHCVCCIHCRKLFASRNYLQLHQTYCTKLSSSSRHLPKVLIRFLIGI